MLILVCDSQFPYLLNEKFILGVLRNFSEDLPTTTLVLECEHKGIKQLKYESKKNNKTFCCNTSSGNGNC